LFTDEEAAVLDAEGDPPRGPEAVQGLSVAENR
jgi:hypothetical protein